MAKLIGIIVCVLLSMLFGYLLGRRTSQPLGDIVFEMVFDEEKEEWRPLCTFKLDLEIDEILEKDYILFGVKKTKEVEYFYNNTEIPK